MKQTDDAEDADESDDEETASASSAEVHPKRAVIDMQPTEYLEAFYVFGEDTSNNRFRARTLDVYKHYTQHVKYPVTRELLNKHVLDKGTTITMSAWQCKTSQLFIGMRFNDRVPSDLQLLVNNFKKECCECAPDHVVNTKVLYDAFKVFATNAGRQVDKHHGLTVRMFRKQLLTGSRVHHQTMGYRGEEAGLAGLRLKGEPPTVTELVRDFCQQKMLFREGLKVLSKTLCDAFKEYGGKTWCQKVSSMAFGKELRQQHPELVLRCLDEK